MNKYTETYLNELDNKRAFIGKALSAGLGAAFQAAKPILAQGAKDALKATAKNVSQAATTSASVARSTGSSGLSAVKGYASGVGTIAKDYLNVLKTPGATASQKALGLVGQTLSTPGKMIGQKPLFQIGAREVGQLAGAATPLIAAGAGAYSLLPEKQYLPRVPASRATFLPSEEESSYFRNLYKDRTGRDLTQKQIDISTIRK